MVRMRRLIPPKEGTVSKQLSREDVQNNLRSQMAEFRYLRTPFREKDIGNPRRPAIEILNVKFLPDDMPPKPLRPTKIEGVTLPEVVRFARDQGLSARFMDGDVVSRILPASSLRMHPVPGKDYDVVVAWQYGRDGTSKEGRATFLDDIRDPAVYVPPPPLGVFIPITAPVFPSLNRNTAKFEGATWLPTGKIGILPHEFAMKMAAGEWGVPTEFHAVEYHSKVVLLPVLASSAEKELGLQHYVEKEIELTEEQFLFGGAVYSIEEELRRERVELPETIDRKSFNSARKTAAKRLAPDKLGDAAPQALKDNRQMKFSKIMAAFERMEEIYFVSAEETAEEKQA
jgi:hypothetical protein